MKKFAKILLLLISVLAFCAAGVIAITQTSGFRNWLKGYVLEMANANLNAHLAFGAIHGNLITGMRIERPVLTLDGETVFTCSALLVRYNPSRLPSKYLSMAEVSIRDAEISIWKGTKDTLWNFERLAKLTGKPPQPFAWTIEAKDVEISNATINTCDSSAVPTSATLISPLRQTLRAVNASLSCRITNAVQIGTINHVSFAEQVSGFRVLDMAGEFYHAADSTRARLDRFQTDRSLVSLDAALGNPGALPPATTFMKMFEKTPVYLKLNAERLSFRDARLFSPALEPFDSTCALTLEARGTPDSLFIRNCAVKLDRSSLTFSGTARRLMTPSEIAGDIKISRSLVVAGEVAARAPGIAAADMGYLGDVNIASAEMKATAAEANFTASAASAIGSVNCNGTITRNASPPRISVRAIFAHVNLQPIMPSSLPASAIAGQAQLSGSGASFSTFKGTAALDFLPTKIAGRTIERASVRCALDAQIVRVDTLRCAFGGGSALIASGSFDLRSTPRYQVQAAFSHFNVAAITLDQKITDVNTDVVIRGEGFDLDSMRLDTLVLRTAKSEIYGRSVPPFTASLKMQRDNAGNLQTDLKSDFGNISVYGVYSIDRLIDKLNAAGSTLGALADDSIMTAFSSVMPVQNDLLVATHKPWLFMDPRPMNATFQMELTNSSLLAAFLESDITVQGSLRGSIRTDSVNSQTNIVTALKRFTLANGDGNIGVGSATIRLDLLQYCIASVPPARPKRGKGRVVLDTGEFRVEQEFSLKSAGDSLNAGNLVFEAPRALVSYNKGEAMYSVSAAMGGESGVSLAIAGKGQFATIGGDTAARRFETTIDNMIFAYRNTIRWEANPRAPVKVAFTRGRIDFHSADLWNDGAELSCAGTLDPPLFHDFNLTLRRFPLAHVQYYADSATFAGLSGVMNLIHCTVNGTMDAPVISIDTIDGDDIKFKQTEFGSLDAAFYLANKDVSGTARLATGGGRGDTTADTAHRVDITVYHLPLDAAFHTVKNRIPDGGQIHARINAESFPIAFMELVVGETVDHLGGSATGTFDVGGTSPHVQYAGTIHVEKVRFRSRSTNIYYTGRADLQLRNDTLHIVRATLMNVPDDLNNGAAELWGNLYFQGFVLTSFDLWASSDLILVLSNASRTVTSSVYGRLVISTQPVAYRNAGADYAGSVPLHFYGTFEEPSLAGKVYITQSNLVFPQTNEIASAGGYDVIYNLSAADGDTTAMSNAVSPTAPGATSQAVFTGGLLDRMRYNLQIETKDPLHMTMDFGPTERLQDLLLTGDMYYRRDAEGATNLYGQLNINGGVYSFFDQFRIDAGSTIRFIDSVQNPRLDITARTAPRLHYPQNNTPEFVQIEVHITGSRLEPNMALTLLRGPNSNALVAQAQNETNQTDALVFLATNEFPEDFNFAGGAAGAGATLGSTTLSQVMNNTFRQMGLDANVNVQINQANPSLSKVSVSSQVGKVLVSAGANALTPMNLDASVSFSLGDLLKIIWLEQTTIEFQRSATTGMTATPQEAVYSARIGALDFMEAVVKGIAQFWKVIF